MLGVFVLTVVGAIGAVGYTLLGKGKVQADWVAPDGTLHPSAVFGAGTTRTLEVTVPSSTSPVSVEFFRTNPDGSVTTGTQPWSVAATGYTYVDSNSTAVPAGDYSVVVTVTFADGSSSSSSPVTFTQE